MQIVRVTSGLPVNRQESLNEIGWFEFAAL